MIESMFRVDHAPRHRRGAGAVPVGELHRVRTGFGVQHIVDVALPPDRNGLGPVTGDLRVAHAREKLRQLVRLGMGEFDEFEAVRAGGVGIADRRGRRVVREGTHGVSSELPSLRKDREGLSAV